MKKLFFVFFLFAQTSFAGTTPRNILCRNAFINNLFVGNDNVCDLDEQVTPENARKFLGQVEQANRKIIKSLHLPQNEPFLNDLSLVLKTSDQSIIDSAYELIDGRPTVRLGTTSGKYFESFSNTIYTHEIGHWYISHYLKVAEGKDGLKNFSTFQEFFADSLVVDIYGGLDTSDIDAPYCIRQIRTVGPGITFNNSIGEFDFASYFKHSNECCRSLLLTGEETELSKTLCQENKSIEQIIFPDGLPVYSKAPLNQNVHSFKLEASLNKVNRLEPHRTSTPMNSFLLELSQKTNISISNLISPALKEVTDSKVAYQCGYEDLLKQSVFEVKESINLNDLDNLFVKIKDHLSTPQQRAVFDTLYHKYSMKTAQVIFRNELIDIAKFAVQAKLKDQLIKIWKEGNYFLSNWHCIDQQTGDFVSDCSFNIICEPEDEQHLLKREFIRRDKNKVAYTPIARFINESTNKEVIFVGLNHTGPRHYFNAIEKYLKHHLESEDTMTLREFFTCKDQTVLNSNVSNIEPDEATTLNNYLTNIYRPYFFFKLNDPELSPLFKTYQLYEDQCVMDLDNKTLRPRNIVQRNEKSCSKAEANSMACQWETVEKLLSSSPYVEEGDLVLDSESHAVQIASVNMYKGLPSGGNLDLWARLSTPALYVLDDYREANLIVNVLNNLKTSKRRIILPWGVGHIQAIKEQLYKHGFVQYQVTEVPYAQMSDYGPDQDINSMLTEDFQYIGEEYNF